MAQNQFFRQQMLFFTLAENQSTTSLHMCTYAFVYVYICVLVYVHLHVCMCYSWGNSARKNKKFCIKI